MSDYMTRLLNRHSIKVYGPNHRHIDLRPSTYRMAVLTLAECGDIVPDDRTLGALGRVDGDMDP